MKKNQNDFFLSEEDEKVLSALEMRHIMGGSGANVYDSGGIKFNISHNCKPIADYLKICY